MGTGPNPIQEKDVIVLIAGLDRPMVLRPMKRGQDGERSLFGAWLGRPGSQE
jgi:hypothetical protein